MSNCNVANRTVKVDHVGRCVVSGMTRIEPQPRTAHTA